MHRSRGNVGDHGVSTRSDVARCADWSNLRGNLRSEVTFLNLSATLLRCAKKLGEKKPKFLHFFWNHTAHEGLFKTVGVNFLPSAASSEPTRASRERTDCRCRARWLRVSKRRRHETLDACAEGLGEGFTSRLE